jgi:hypothetical protein
VFIAAQNGESVLKRQRRNPGVATIERPHTVFNVACEAQVDDRRALGRRLGLHVNTVRYRIGRVEEDRPPLGSRPLVVSYASSPPAAAVVVGGAGR